MLDQIQSGTGPMAIDLFAGGGGASEGFYRAFGRHPDIAINHDAEAIAMHAANHPDTIHFNRNIWDVQPEQLKQPGRNVGFMWASPDCKHFSSAAGGKPKDRNIRDLAWVVIKYARVLMPDVIALENVMEFKTWGPICDEGKIIKGLEGVIYEEWQRQLKALGYKLQWRELRACDYGAPTIRKRLFMVARRDGKPIVWPDPTHGDPKSDAVKSGKLKPWRSAASIINWETPIPSIFMTQTEANAWAKTHGLKRAPKRPLVDNTMRRIARGIQKYVIDAKQPFFVTYAQQGGNNRSAVDPLHTITASYKDQNAIIVPSLVSYYGEGQGGKDRSHSIESPVTTVTTSNRHALVAAHMMPHYGTSVAADIRAPAGTMTPVPKQMLISSFLAQHNGGPNNDGLCGRSAADPLSTLTTRGTQQNIVSAFLLKYYGTAQGADLSGPLHTLTARDRFGLVTVEIGGEKYKIVDIGMRMLTPREQFRAQGFNDDYKIDIQHGGKPITKEAKTRMCGNSVSPDVADAIAAANCWGMF